MRAIEDELPEWARSVEAGLGFVDVRFGVDCVAKLGSFWRRGSAESFGDPVCRSAVEGVAALAPTATTAAPMLGKRLRTMVERG